MSGKNLDPYRPQIVDILSTARSALVAACERAVDELNRPSQATDEAYQQVSAVCRASRQFASSVHRLKMELDWNIPPNPEWFDHYCDIFYQLEEKRSTFWMERGVYGRLPFTNRASKPRILELCCGDGFNTKFMYAPYAESVLAVDFDAHALRHAARENQAANVDYRAADIRRDFPAGRFDGVVWDAAIEHFSEIEIDALLKQVAGAIGSEGVLSGYTLVEKDDGTKHIHQHEREFKGKEDLLGLLRPHFERCTVFETKSAERHNLYFYASNGAALPFDSDWSNATVLRKVG